MNKTKTGLRKDLSKVGTTVTNKVVVVNRSVEWLVTLYNNCKIFVDYAYQRYACWSESTKQDFIQELLKGETAGQLRFCSNRPHSNHELKDKNHFKDLHDQGYQYSSIDGNNRSTTLAEFFNNEFSIQFEGEKKVFYNKLNLEKGETNLEENHRNILKNVTVSIVVYFGTSRAQCAASFRSHNQSTKLKAQEILNSYPYAISKWIRDEGNKIVKKKNGKPVSVNTPGFTLENHRLENHEFLTSLAKYQDDYKIPTPPTQLAKFWAKYKDEEQWGKFNKTYFKATIKQLNKLVEKSKLTKHKSVQTLIRDYGIVRGMLFKDDVHYGKENVEKFMDKFLELRSVIMQSDHKHELDDKGKTEIRYSGIISASPNTTSYFNKRVEILKDLLQEIKDDKDILQYTKRSNLSSDEATKHDLALKMNYKTIDGEDIIDPTVLETDHEEPLVHAGNDDTDNMILLTLQQNRSKGSNK